MEEYWALNWSRRTFRAEEQFEEIVAYDANCDPQDVWNMHLNDIDPTLVSSSSANVLENTNRPFVDPRNKLVVEHPQVIWGKWTNERKFTMFNMFPMQSVLKQHEHILGIKAIQASIKEYPSEEDLKLIEQFSLLKGKIEKDRKEFDEFLKDYTVARLGERYAHPGIDLTNLGKLCLSTNQAKSDDSCYSIQTGIRPGIGDNHSDLPEMKLEFVEELKTMGLLHRIKITVPTPLQGVLTKPLEHAKRFLLKDPQVMRNYKSFIVSHGRTSGGLYLNVEMLYRILSADRGSSSWMIPFFVHDSETNDKFIYFENPIIKRQHLSPFELERVGLELCYQSSISRADQFPYSFDEGKYLEKTKERCDSNKRGKIELEVELETNQDDEDTRLVIDNEDGDHENEGEEQKDKKDCGEVQGKYKLIEFDEYLRKFAKEDHKEPQNILINRFKLNSPDDLDSLSIIVAGSCDGVQNLENQNIFVNLSFKFEYKSEFGAQKMSIEELLKEWCSIAFSSQIKYILRIRVDYVTSVIMSIVHLTREDIEKELDRLYQIKPERLLSTVSTLLKLVKQFPAGKYLLNKDRQNAQILIYMDTNDSGKPWKEILDCPIANSNLIKIPPIVDLPIDDQLVTQLHKRHQVIPGCIPPTTKKSKQEKKGNYTFKESPYWKRQGDWKKARKELITANKQFKKKYNASKKPN